MSDSRSEEVAELRRQYEEELARKEARILTLEAMHQEASRQVHEQQKLLLRLLELKSEPLVGAAAVPAVAEAAAPQTLAAAPGGPHAHEPTLRFDHPPIAVDMNGHAVTDLSNEPTLRLSAAPPSVRIALPPLPAHDPQVAGVAQAIIRVAGERRAFIPAPVENPKDVTARFEPGELIQGHAAMQTDARELRRRRMALRMTSAALFLASALIILLLWHLTRPAAEADQTAPETAAAATLPLPGGAIPARPAAAAPRPPVRKATVTPAKPAAPAAVKPKSSNRARRAVVRPASRPRAARRAARTRVTTPRRISAARRRAVAAQLRRQARRIASRPRPRMPRAAVSRPAKPRPTHAPARARPAVPREQPERVPGASEEFDLPLPDDAG